MSMAIDYPDASGVMHAFSEANFTDFAAAVRDYVYALKSAIAGRIDDHSWRIEDDR
jgi:hypothetical protein